MYIPLTLETERSSRELQSAFMHLRPVIYFALINYKLYLHSFATLVFTCNWQLKNKYKIPIVFHEHFLQQRQILKNANKKINKKKNKLRKRQQKQRQLKREMASHLMYWRVWFPDLLSKCLLFRSLIRPKSVCGPSLECPHMGLPLRFWSPMPISIPLRFPLEWQMLRTAG